MQRLLLSSSWFFTARLPILLLLFYTLLFIPWRKHPTVAYLYATYRKDALTNILNSKTTYKEYRTYVQFLMPPSLSAQLHLPSDTLTVRYQQKDVSLLRWINDPIYNWKVHSPTYNIGLRWQRLHESNSRTIDIPVPTEWMSDNVFLLLLPVSLREDEYGNRPQIISSPQL